MSNNHPAVWKKSLNHLWVVQLGAWVAVLLMGGNVNASDLAESGDTATTTAPSEAAFGVDYLEGAGDEADGSNGLLDVLGENLRLNVDIISRVETTRRRGEAAALNAIGLDLQKIFSDEKGDIATLLFQPYVVRRDNALPIPQHVEDDDDWEFEIHDFYLNVTRWGAGRTNFKIGHFDVPLGLEPNVDTHFTVRQLIPGPNLGQKKDWGVSLNDNLPSFDYEVALTQGSGAEFNAVNLGTVGMKRSAGQNWAASGRASTVLGYLQTVTGLT